MLVGAGDTREAASQLLSLRNRGLRHFRIGERSSEGFSGDYVLIVVKLNLIQLSIQWNAPSMITDHCAYHIGLPGG